MLHWKEPNEPRNDISHPLSNQADLALQLTGNTELTVNRAIVEIQKLITDSELPLRIATFFSGFKREDRRSWIDFHDGINTMSSEERQMAIEVTEPDQSWIVGGTFMCFLRIQVDLESWRKLSRQQQELIVGRDKLSGCPISQINRSPNNELEVKLISKCPFSGAIPLDAPPEYIDPPKATDPLLVASHIHRANFNRDSAQQPANNRIYRQGYEFLSPSPDGSLSLGLNFVSFQRDLKFVKTILELPSWMGGVNFGGPANPNPGEPTPIRLMSLIAGGFYAVPPIADPFPGASIFEIG
jgi:deferrochelatase/peroxidase EfeB